ncbi:MULTISPECIES: recombinase family protein [unclassified Endozoicomonas]
MVNYLWLNEQGYASPRGTTWKETPVRKLYRHPAVYGAYTNSTF